MASPTLAKGTAPSVAIAAGIVLLGILAGLVVGGAFAAGGPRPSPQPRAAVQSTRHSPAPPTRHTQSPRPSPSATPTPSQPAELAIPTAGATGPYGLPPPLAPLAIEGADATVVAEITAAVDAIADASSYRYRGGISGRSVFDLSTGGLNFGVEASATQGAVSAVDALVASQMVEFDGSAAITSTERYVLIGDEAWTFRDGVVEPIVEIAFARTLTSVILPHGLAERVLIPFAGGYERVGSEAFAEVGAVHYRAAPAGLDAYSAVTGIEGTWSADLWIAEAGYLAGLRIHGEAADGSDGFLVEIDVSDVNDPTIVIARPV